MTHQSVVELVVFDGQTAVLGWPPADEDGEGGRGPGRQTHHRSRDVQLVLRGNLKKKASGRFKSAAATTFQQHVQGWLRFLP